LKTLDGTDFKDDQELIKKMKAQEEAKKKGKSDLATIPEKGGSSAAPSSSGKAPIDKCIKA